MYYQVNAKCGHVGKENYILIAFPIKANSAKEAAKITRSIPRVKHDWKDAIVSVNEINYEEYKLLQLSNSNDEYLKCKNVQEQKIIENLEERIIYQIHDEVEEKLYIWKSKKAIKNMKKYFKFYGKYTDIDEYEYAY